MAKSTLTPTLIDSPTWEKLLHSAENSFGKTESYYESPEPKLFDELLEEFNGDMDYLVDQVLELLAEESNPNNESDRSWAALKEAATLMHHLQLKDYVPDDEWECVITDLWSAMGEFGQGQWSDYEEYTEGEQLPAAWKRKKFGLDALLTTIKHINKADGDRVERFFNSKMSSYWKAYQVTWPQLWGDYHQNWERYFQVNRNRKPHKLKTYRLLKYRLEHFDSEFPLHRHKPQGAFEILKLNPEEIPESRKARKEIFEAVFGYLIQSGEKKTIEEDLATLKGILGDDDCFEFLFDSEYLDSDQIAHLLLTFSDLEERWKSSKTSQDKILSHVFEALNHDDLSVRESAIEFLKPNAKELFRYLRHLENDEEGDGAEFFQLLATIYDQDIVRLLLNNFSFTSREKGKFLLKTPRILEARWEEKEFPNYQDILPHILAVVEHEEGSLQADASNFLKRKSTVIQKQLDDLIASLDQNEDKALDMIASAIEFGSDTALKAILEKCTLWVAMDQNTTLVDRAAQKARYTPAAVLAIINLLNNPKGLDKNEEVVKYVRGKVIRTQQNPTVRRVFKDYELTLDEISTHTLDQLYKWCLSQRAKSKVYADLVSSSEHLIFNRQGVLKARPLEELVKSILNVLAEEELHEREIAVQKWLTQLLSEMSDSWFFKKEHHEDIYNEIKEELERLAIEPLSKRLPEEENLDIRENLVKILGNIGGRVAVDALVRTVTGEERRQAARQELLSEYYLKPSKARSEEASVLLKDAVTNAKKTMRLLQNLNMATFVMGAILILGGVAISVISKELGGRVTGAITGLGGLAAVITQFMKDPLERIQRAMADLVQVQTAFTSFIWELNLNGTYIQSQYVSEGVLTDFDIRQTVDRIDHAMERTISMIHVYANGMPVETKKAPVLAKKKPEAAIQDPIPSEAKAAGKKVVEKLTEKVKAEGS
jgi:HEAT repeat protein